MAIWLYKCNDKDGSPTGSFGDWERDVFSFSGPTEWGGTRSTASPESARYILEEMAIDDQIVSYQTDITAMIGICDVVDLRPDKSTHMIDLGGLDGIAMYLVPTWYFDPVIKIHKVKHGTILEDDFAINGAPMLRPLTVAKARKIVQLSGESAATARQIIRGR
jgi:hypothetical protein